MAYVLKLNDLFSSFDLALVGMITIPIFKSSFLIVGNLCSEQLQRDPLHSYQTETGGLPRSSLDDIPPCGKPSGDSQRTGNVFCGLQ